MAVPVSLRSKISNVMQLGKNRDSWMNINPEMRDELEMAYEGQMGQLKNELGSEVRSMGIPRRPDYPGGEAINRSQPTLVGGAIGKISKLMGGLGKKIVGEDYGQDKGIYARGAGRDSPELSLTSRSRWDDEFKKHKDEEFMREISADDAVSRSLSDIKSEIDKLEYESKGFADELSWIENNKDALDPETYRAERIRVMGEWGKRAHQVRQLMEEQKKIGLPRRVVDAPKESTTRRHEIPVGEKYKDVDEDFNPFEYENWDEGTRMEYDKIRQDIKHIDDRLSKTSNPHTTKALLADRYELQTRFRKRFGRNFGKRPNPMNFDTDRPNSDKFRQMMLKTLYGHTGAARPIMDMVGGVYRRATEPDATSVSPDQREGDLLGDIGGVGSFAMNASMLAGKGAVRSAIPQTLAMMGLEELTKDAPAAEIVSDRPSRGPRIKTGYRRTRKGR